MFKKISPQNLSVFLMFLVVLFFMKCSNTRSTYVLKPSVLNTNSTAGEPSDISNLKYDLSCVPGPQDTASYYTKGLAPGGICQAQEFVVQQAEGYTITNGIGGSLMDN